MNKSELVENILSRLQELKEVRSKFESSWMQAERLVAPSIYAWHDLDAVPSAPKRFASEPCKYMQTLVAGLVGYSISPSIQWFKLSLQNADMLNQYGVRDWLENCESALVSEFNRSNLYSVVSKFIQDAVVIGHSSLHIGEDIKNARLQFMHERANEVYLDVSGNGEVDTLYREYRMTVRQMVDFFGLDACSEQVREDYADPKKRSFRHTVLFAVYPRTEYKDDRQDALNMPFAAVYIDMDGQHVLLESGYRDFPYAVYVFKQIPGYAYSESLAQDAVPDIEFLNIAKETSLRIAQTSAEPPMKASEHLKNIAVVPRGMTYLTENDDILEPIRTGENYPITLQVLADIKQTIKDWFNVDFFLMLEGAQNKQMTATEVMEKQGEKAAILSDLIVSLNEATGQIIRRSFNLLMRAGRLPVPPEAIREAGAIMKIEYKGPLAQAQQKYYSTGTIRTALSAIAPVMQIFPNSGDFIDADELMKKTMENSGMPQSVIREDRDVMELRAERLRQQQEAAAREQQQAMSQEMLKNMDKWGKSPEQGSFMDAMNSQLGTGMNGASAYAQ